MAVAVLRQTGAVHDEWEHPLQGEVADPDLEVCFTQGEEGHFRQAAVVFVSPRELSEQYGRSLGPEFTTGRVVRRG
ncbi:hypothetical protein ACWGCK_18025 [Streptomyces virginiae]